jgi:hypothetical protein
VRDHPVAVPRDRGRQHDRLAVLRRQREVPDVHGVEQEVQLAAILAGLGAQAGDRRPGHLVLPASGMVSGS